MKSITHDLFFVSAFLGATALTPALASNSGSRTLVSGSATVDFDLAAWNTLAGDIAPTPNLTLDEVFDRAEADATDSTGLFTIDVDVAPDGQNLVYDMYGETVVNMPGRTAQPTTFEFTLGHLTGHTGAIGLGGVTRWEVDADAGGGALLYGDYTLQYDAARIAVGGSGWYLLGNIPPAAPAFDLLNVSTSDAGGVVSISGDLAVTFEVANFLYGTPSDALKDVGDFSFSATHAAPAVGSSYCPGVPNSSGQAATLAAFGSDTASPLDLTFEVEQLPASTAGLLFFGPQQINASFGDGLRCVGGATRRVQPAQPAMGAATVKLNGAAPYATSITAGANLNFQFWYRDNPAMMAGYNTSSAVSIAFQ